MRVKIGPYKNWIGPYQIADWLQYIGVNEETRYKIGGWLADTWVNSVSQWIYAKYDRKVKIRIDEYDTWNMDKTLAMIIVPMLIQLKKTTHGYPPDLTEEEWNKILDKMIWSFREILEDDWESKYIYNYGKYHFEEREPINGEKMSEMVWDVEPVIDIEGIRLHSERIDEGLMLFGKYYKNLWD